MPDIAPFLFERAETAPTVPAEGRFLLPLCVTEEELHLILGAVLYHAEISDDKECRHLIPLMQAMEYIGQVEYAECMGFFESEADDCKDYLPFAPFADYYPSNPYNDPDFIPDGYVVPPFLRNTNFDYPEAFGYKASDIFVPFSALTIDPGTVATLNYPMVKISVRGSGQIELDLLSVQQGGYAIMKIGSPPNLVDILLDLTIAEGVEIYDLDSDSLSIPPEDDIVSAQEINIEAAANETTDVYVVFVPKLNDSLIPLGFGGGIRSIGLCGFEQDGMMAGIEDVRFNEVSCAFEKRVNGVWSPIAGDWTTCIPEPTGGAGGAGAMKVTTLAYQIGGSVTNSSTNYNQVFSQPFTPAYSKMLVIMGNITTGSTNATNFAELRITFNGGAGAGAVETRQNSATIVKEGTISERFEGLTPGVSQNLRLELRSTVNGTVSTVTNNSEISITIIEYDNPEDLYVEDVRISGRELQKKIGGVWLTASDSLDAILDSIDAQISTINNTLSVHQSQIITATNVNNTQNVRLSALESRATNIENDVNQAETDINSLESAVTGAISVNITQNNRLDALEAASGGGSSLGSWGGYRLRSITVPSVGPGVPSIPGPQFESLTNNWNSGWESDSAGKIEVILVGAAKFNTVAYMRVSLQLNSYSGGKFRAKINNGDWGSIEQNISGVWAGWIKVPNTFDFVGSSENMTLFIETTNSANVFRFTACVFSYININPFDGSVSD